jgi:NADH:ubiquinone oxidoreductase subunit 2 (subunit N)
LSFRHPFAAFAMLLFMLSLGGIPPTAGFMGSSAVRRRHRRRLCLAGGDRPC